MDQSESPTSQSSVSVVVSMPRFGKGGGRFRPVLHISGMRPIPAQFRRESLPGMGHWAENSVSHRKTVTVQSLELVPVTLHPQNR